MTTLADLERRNPEWRACLAALSEVLSELENPASWEERLLQLNPVREGESKSDIPLAVSAGVDPAEAPIALLHACRRRWGVPQAWVHAYCPICGAWPGFAEICGVERTRYLRCLRCGSGWRAHGLSCVFCRNGDHAELRTLVPETERAGWAMEACSRCRGYLKSFTRLTMAPPEKVVLEDLASVELDLAAEDRGYRRPPGEGYAHARDVAA